MSLWHNTLLGTKTPEEFNAIIEIPKGSNNKYEIDKETGLIALDRANYNAAAYPFDYGFAPQTLWEDDDPLDVIVLTTYPLSPGILVKVRPVALMDMIDSGESDVKIVAVPVDDRRWDDVQGLEDLNKHMLKEYKHFFETYKELKNDTDNEKLVTVSGYKNIDEAKKAIERSTKLYKERFGSQ
jgi:inorganic pyrophosphatase